MTLSEAPPTVAALVVLALLMIFTEGLQRKGLRAERS
jgi:hypothetical protein